MPKLNYRAAALFLFLYLFSVQALFAQKMFFRNYTVTDGLCSNTIWDITQDEEGYMWFGTKYGLNRFDGYEFKSFQYHEKLPGSLGNNFIRKIFSYNATTFWIGTDEGLYIFNLKNQKFSLFKPLGKQFINDIVRTKSGDIWIATKTNGLYQYIPQEKHLINYRYHVQRPSISSNEIAKVIEDNEGKIWIGTYGKGIDVLDPKTKQIRHFEAGTKNGSLSSNFILELYKDLDGQIWAGTMSGGLNLWDKASGRFQVFKKSGGNSISDNIVRSIYQPKPGLLYLGTEKGLNVLDLKTRQFTAYQNKNNDPLSLSDDAVYKIFKDNEGGIWAGTYFGGLNYYNEKSSGFEYYYPTGVSNSLSGNAVSAFLEVSPQRFLIGTEDGGLNYYNAQEKSFKKFPFEGQDTLSYHNIHALYKDKKENIWIGMYTGGLNVYHPGTGKIRRYKNDPANPFSLSDNSIYSINEDRKGRIWVSTISGLNLYDPQKDHFIRIAGEGLDKSCIYQVYEDKEGMIWVATYDRGLMGIDSKTNKITTYTHQNKAGSISSNKVICIYDDEQGNLWLGTDAGGLNIFNKKTKQFRTGNEEYGISSAVIYGILKGSDHTLWLSANNGIFEIDLKKKSTRYFGKWDNLQSQQYNYKSFYKSTDGKLYFGGINGFNAFYPDSIKNTNSPMHLLFTNFQLFNKDVAVDEKNGPLHQSIDYTKDITLAHSQSVISFEYAALSFIAPNKIQYAFKMEGFDKNWNDVGSQRKATYTNLPAGDYVFKVKDTSGNPENKMAEIRLTVLPPWYKSNLAYFIYGLLLVAVILYSRKALTEKARKRNEIKLERLKNKSEQEFYKQKIDFFTAMAHEIKTPLSLIVAPLERMINTSSTQSANWEHLKVMEENSDRLLTLVNQLLDFRRIESDVFKLYIEKLELVSFVNSMYERFKLIAEKKGIDFSMKSSIKKLNICADGEALTKILGNLLTNAFKFSRSRVLITINPVKIKGDQKFFSITVEDDGIGIPEDQISYIFTKFFKVISKEHHYSNLGGTGIGLSLSKSLSEKHGGELLVKSKEGHCTTFTVLLPLTTVSEQINIPVDTRLPDEVFPEEVKDNRPMVLVVEDDMSMRDFLEKSFSEEGYQIITAANGAEALVQAEKHDPDMIISDVMMPVMDGVEFCAKIKGDINFSHIPVILLTAKTNSDAEIEGLESGADYYLPKPFKWKQLALITRNLMEIRGTLKQKFSQQPFSSTDILSTGSRDKKFLNKLIEAIEERISDPQLSVEELGREVGLSRSSLYKKVKSLTGHVPNEFIRLIRLKHAAKLLSEHGYNISEIGYMVGFSSHSYFSKCFYQQFKLTPTEFAEQHSKVGDS
jgi:signal transduction histidine kinase/ligand-binding sensor domain-containing protein/AraC-like DNA-binding protein